MTHESLVITKSFWTATENNHTSSPDGRCDQRFSFAKHSMFSEGRKRPNARFCASRLSKTRLAATPIFQRNSRLAVSDEVSRGNPSGRTPFWQMWQHCAARYRSLSPGTAVDGSCWLPVAVASPFANGLLRASIVYPPRLLDLQFFFFLVLVSDIFFLYLLLINT